HQLLFGRKPFLIQYQDFAAVCLGVMLEPLEPNARQPVFVGEDSGVDAPLPDLIHQCQKTLALDHHSHPLSPLPSFSRVVSLS
ncbi:hypothetical protein, partial [Rhabdochromatium marinum]|uniref:hypothetical protein n=1 Tax=Rhabdochromatium marinum TaxID=48729 RepID=UPI001A922EB1